MRIGIAGSNDMIGFAATHRSMPRKVLLAGDIVSFPLCLAGHTLAGMQLEDYCHIDQMVSELSAVGARSLGGLL